MKYKFAHIADLHLGGWRNSRLRELNFEAFKKSVEICIEERVDFIIFAGDIFDNSLPSLDIVDLVVLEFMKLKKANIPIFIIGGSHDYSLTGNSFLKILESAEVLFDVGKWEVIGEDEISLIPTKFSDDVNIFGVSGRKNELEKFVLRNISDLDLDKSFNIFMFHTTLQDLKPKDLKYFSKTNSSDLPLGFDYYAGGHIHCFIEGRIGSSPLFYPGPLFPNSFNELKNEKPSFIISSIDTKSKEVNIKREFLHLYDLVSVDFILDSKVPSLEMDLAIDKLKSIDLNGKLVLLNFTGILDGNISDLQIQKIVDFCYENGADIVLKKTSQITTLSFKDIKTKSKSLNKSDIESEILDKYFQGDLKKKVNSLFNLNLQKLDGEKVYQYEERVINSISKVLDEGNKKFFK